MSTTTQRSLLSQIEFSVIIPTYNRASLLPRALDSILEQSHPAREIIVVDDGSSDQTARLIQHEYPTIRYRYQRHRGVSAARNHGISVARAPWIALLDSDDVWCPEKLCAQALAIRQNPGARLVHTNETWWRNGRPLQQRAQHRKHGGDIFQHCVPRCVISPSSAVIRGDVFTDIGGFDESLKACEDYDYWLRFCARYPVVFINEPLITKFGGHLDQLSRTTVGLDQYRIQVLCKLLDSNRLNAGQRRLVVATLHEKIDIYVNGAKKRGRLAEVEHYNRIALRLNNV